jgi:hypothetical protein
MIGIITTFLSLGLVVGSGFINSSPLWVLIFVCDSIDYHGGA